MKQADSLAYIASMLGESEARTIPIEFQPEPSIANRPHAEAFPVTQDLGPSWMDPYIRYLRDGELPDDRREAAKIRQKAGKYILIEGVSGTSLWIGLVFLVGILNSLIS
ncbi:hypothetical protein Ddye_007870 [Dipteronia dyeriana]|uniref:Uncharacterized protein n=1 Tax=Dipteronia dyeriana TaxID=168575 RepID=A0AAD9XLC4_9ROSI|nr:hypothetical protein Ddye_007870 [Dipteronia dyeriana]